MIFVFLLYISRANTPKMRSNSFQKPFQSFFQVSRIPLPVTKYDHSLWNAFTIRPNCNTPSLVKRIQSPLKHFF